MTIAPLKGLKSVNELASLYQVHPTQISQRKRQVQVGAKELFAPANGKAQDHKATQAKLYEEVGRLKMELDWIKKTAGLG